MRIVLKSLNIQTCLSQDYRLGAPKKKGLGLIHVMF